MKKIICFIFGHEPEYTGGNNVHCSRCDLWDIPYHELIEGRRFMKAVLFLKYWLYRKWFPAKCFDCGKRYADHSQCIPF